MDHLDFSEWITVAEILPERQVPRALGTSSSYTRAPVAPTPEAKNQSINHYEINHLAHARHL